jgi:hypothetical protein
MVSVERIKQFTNLPSEAAWKIADKSPPQNWPNHGTIELNNLQVCLSSCILTFLHISKHKSLYFVLTFA